MTFSDFAKEQRLTPSERETLEKALARMRNNGVGSNGRRITFGDLTAFHNREAKRYEELGVLYARDHHDASHNLIIEFLIDKDDRRFFRNRNR